MTMTAEELPLSVALDVCQFKSRYDVHVRWQLCKAATVNTTPTGSMSSHLYTQSAAFKHKHLALAVLAGLRSVLTVVAAILTWLTVWHFSETPFPLFYGWTFAIIYHTLGSAITAACSAPSTRVVMALWRWGSNSSTTNNLDSPVQPAQVVPVAARTSEAGHLPQHTQPCGTISTQANRHSSCNNSACLARLLKLFTATAALLLLFAAYLVVHGGAVLADWHLARSYLAVRAAPTKQARQQLARAQQSARECAVTLSLLFLAPAISIKWALVMILGDFSWIPVLSVITSSITYTVVTSCFLSSTFIYSRVWTLKHRVLGVAAVAATVLGQFLWRIGARSFLVLKFGGEAYFLYTTTMHVVIGIGVVARSRSSRQAYLDAFAANKIQVFLLTLSGAALASDFLTFYEGLKSRSAASRASWLKKLAFSSNSMAMLAWRVLEGIICYIIILTVHAMVPCSTNMTPVDEWKHMCAAIAQQWYIWRPRCWGCSMFDRYYLGDAYQRQVILTSMLVPAGVLLLFVVLGLLVLRRLLCEVSPDASVHRGASATLSTSPASISTSPPSISTIAAGACTTDASAVNTGAKVRHEPAETLFAKRHQLDESQYDYIMDGPEVRDNKSVNWLITGGLPSHVRHSLEVQSVVQNGSQLVLWPSIVCASRLLCIQSPNARQSQLASPSTIPLCRGAGNNTASMCLSGPSITGVTDHSSCNSSVVVSIPYLDIVPPVASRQEVAGCSSHCFSERGLPGSQTALHNASSFWSYPSEFMPVGVHSSQATPQPDAANTADLATPWSNRLLKLHAMGFAVLVALCDLIVFNCNWVLSLVLVVVGAAYMLWEHVSLHLQRNQATYQAR